MLVRGADERNIEAGVVKLPVKEFDASHEALGAHARKARSGGIRLQGLRAPERGFARHHVVEREADRIDFALPLLEARQHEGFRVHEVRGIIDEHLALVERLGDESPVAGILHVAHAAVNELRRARGRPGRKILRIKEQGREASRGRIHCDAGARRAAAHDDDVPEGIRLHAGERLSA